MTESTAAIEVKTVAPDELVARGMIRLPDLIKVDVQGHGAHALQGSMNSIRERRPVVIYSNHSRWEMTGTRALLAPLGYQPHSLEGCASTWESLTDRAALLLPALHSRPVAGDAVSKLEQR